MDGERRLRVREVAGRVAVVCVAMVAVAGVARAADDVRREGGLARALERAGLEVEPPVASTDRSGASGTVVGVLPGTGHQEVVLMAVCEPATDVGAAGLGAGEACELAISAAADLARTPRRHTVRLRLLPGDGESLDAVRRWLDGLSVGERGTVLALLHVEAPQSSSGGLVLRPGHGRASGRARPTPGWLVHAALRGVEAVGGVATVESLPWQLASRLGTVRRATAADLVEAVGIPALGLAGDPSADGVRAGAGPPLRPSLDRQVAAVVRRLDGLAGRPRPEAEYLTLFGRVWLRRDLCWVGFLAWLPLVWHGLPGRWRGADAEARRRRGRRYLPGFAFRMSYLVAVFAAPVFTVVLLLPSALLGLLAHAGAKVRRYAVLGALFPTAAFALFLVYALARGLRLDGAALGPALAVGLPIATFVAWMWPSPPSG